MSALNPRTCLQVASGAVVDLAALEPDLTDVTLEDVAHSLSRLPRFLGHTRGDTPYSVAQHSCLVMALLDDGATRPLEQAAILHDAHEALMGDIPTPLKLALGGAATAIEVRLQRAIHRRFHVSVNLIGHYAVDWADKQALATERAALLAPCRLPWGANLPDASEHDVTPWRAEYARTQFLIHARMVGLN
jgi:5'-deoxynucleotidase YfbR-like HD superfamily hydrolase